MSIFPKLRFSTIAAIAAIALILGITLAGTAQPSEAAGPTALSRTPWQQMITPYPAVGIVLSNPAPIHGDTRYYSVAPSVPAENDVRWTPALDPNTVNFHKLSRLASFPCLQAADFSFFQTIVTIPTGTTISTFTISFSDTDDGARVTIFNSSYPSGVVVPTSYVFLGGNQTADLSGYAATGSNRLVVTQVDDCYSGNNLGYAAVVLNGIVIPPNVPPTVSANSASVSTPEGTPAANTGFYNDADAGQTVSITASAGTVTKTGTNTGTWSWSNAAPDGPAAYPVTITANDGNGGGAQTTFNVTVTNVAPKLDIAGANTVYYVDWTAANPGAGTASGVITLPDASTINVTFEAKNPGGTASSFYGAQTSGGTNFWNPSNPYISTQVPNAPPTPDILQLSGGNSTIYKVTLSSAIVDPIMAIVSLGSGGNTITYDFDSPFTIVSQATGFFGGCNTCLVSLAGDILQGTEGHGTIKFLGTYSTFTWTVPTNEVWHGFTFGARSSQALANTVFVNEGQTATDNGTWSDVPADTVTLTASTGTVTKNANGTWGWSFLTSDGPAQSQTITITASDEDGGVTPKTFPLVVANVAPTVNAIAGATINEGSIYGSCAGAVLNPANGHYYKAVATPANWNTANAAASAMTCGSAAGHLVTITSAQEEGFIEANFPAAVSNPAGFGYWIGARETGFGPMAWVTGEPFVYTRWNFGEPNGAGSPDEAIHFFGLGTFGMWNDASAAGYTFPGYVVEFESGAAQGSFTDPGADTPWTGTVNYGDGTGVQPLTINQANKTFSLSHPYGDNGVFTVTVTITDKNGASGTASTTVTVNNVPPTATFNAPASVIETEIIALSLTGASDVPADMPTLQYAFDCGSGFGPLGPGNTATCTAGSPGTVTVKGKVQDKDGGFNTYTRTVTITAAVPPPFNVDTPLPDADACLCLPPFMVQDPAKTHFWWARATGVGNLVITPYGISVNSGEAGTLTFTVQDPFNAVIDTVVIPQPATMGTEEAGTPVTITGATAGQLYRIKVQVAGVPNTPVARHYRLKLHGASLLGANSPLQAQAEHEEANWQVNAAAGETVSVQVTPGPEAGATTGTIELRDANGAPVASGPMDSTLSAPATAANAGAWTLSVLGSDGHYVINKTSGPDRGVYVNWKTWGYGNLSGAITRAGLPNATPVTVKVTNNLTGAVQTFPDVTDSYSAVKVPAGSYTVQVITPLNLVAPASVLVNIICDRDSVADFDIPNRPPSADAGTYSVPEGGSVGLNGAGNDDDLDAVTFSWDLDNNGTFETPGQTPTFPAAGRDGPSSQTIVLKVCDPFGACATSQGTVKINNVAPVITDLAATSPIDENGAATVNGTFTDPGTPDVHTVYVTWGDGASESFVLPVGVRSFSRTHQYLDDGASPGNGTASDTYTVNVKVGDDDAGVGGGDVTITVNNVAPALNAGPAQTLPFGSVVNINATFTDPGTQDTWATTINWGDGSPVQTGSSSPITGNHQYVVPGNQTVTVCVADDDLGSVCKTVSITFISTTGKITAGVLRFGNNGRGGFNVQSADGVSVKGELEYHNGAVNLHAHTMTAIAVSPDRTKGWFAGVLTDGRTFVAYVEDNGEPGRTDVFRMWVNGALQNGDGKLTGGNVQIHKS